MKNFFALGAFLLSAAIASCSSGGSTSKGANAGVGGEAAGQPSAGGGDEASDAGAPSSTGGGMTSVGEAGQAGNAEDTFSIEGTVYAPKGGDVESTVVIGCAWIDDACDELKSRAVQLGESRSSGAYTLEDLESGPTYLVLFWKDMNGSGAVDDDVGVVADESGAARAFTGAAAGADGVMAVQRAVVVTDVPSELVGDWFAVASSIGVTNAWTFNADGSASNGFTLNSSVCGGGAGMAINSQGIFSVEGDQLVFSPASGRRPSNPAVETRPRPTITRTRATSPGGWALRVRSPERLCTSRTNKTPTRPRPRFKSSSGPALSPRLRYLAHEGCAEA